MSRNVRPVTGRRSNTVQEAGLPHTRRPVPCRRATAGCPATRRPRARARPAEETTHSSGSPGKELGPAEESGCAGRGWCLAGTWRQGSGQGSRSCTACGVGAKSQRAAGRDWQTLAASDRAAAVPRGSQMGGVVRTKSWAAAGAGGRGTSRLTTPSGERPRIRRRRSGAWPVFTSSASPCQGVPWMVKPVGEDGSRRRITRSSLRTVAPGQAARHSRLVVDLPAPLKPANRRPSPAGVTTPQAWQRRPASPFAEIAQQEGPQQRHQGVAERDARTVPRRRPQPEQPGQRAVARRVEVQRHGQGAPGAAEDGEAAGVRPGIAPQGPEPPVGEQLRVVRIRRRSVPDAEAGCQQGRCPR